MANIIGLSSESNLLDALGVRELTLEACFSRRGRRSRSSSAGSERRGASRRDDRKDLERRSRSPSRVSTFEHVSALALESSFLSAITLASLEHPRSGEAFRTEISFHSQDSSREAFVIEPQSEAERSRAIQSIENSGFKQQKFVSKRNQQQKSAEEVSSRDKFRSGIHSRIVRGVLRER